MEMAENTYFMVTVDLLNEDAKGRIKKQKQQYVVQGISPTDVEAKVTKELEGYDFEISKIAATKIVDIIK
jgi:hypothetical protein